jgi:hypothetical protein
MVAASASPGERWFTGTRRQVGDRETKPAGYAHEPPTRPARRSRYAERPLHRQRAGCSEVYEGPVRSAVDGLVEPDRGAPNARPVLACGGRWPRRMSLRAGRGAGSTESGSTATSGAQQHPAGEGRDWVVPAAPVPPPRRGRPGPRPRHRRGSTATPGRPPRPPSWWASPGRHVPVLEAFDQPDLPERTAGSAVGSRVCHQLRHLAGPPGTGTPTRWSALPGRN